ncbi:WAP four-disulfide core domain protein 3 [Ictalurus punctatus]|uniref:WAP four-disulfide core domain protein 3 n=1 Tax=Ictalurus punctatus TaxID=7998 RepID=A0A2D0SJT3_ICTPU|nr:WAP four-disulfide core domain protein 3 [Ictalurus punctatus]
MQTTHFHLQSIPLTLSVLVRFFSSRVQTCKRVQRKMKLKLLSLFTLVLFTLTEWPNLIEGAAARNCTVKPGICPRRKWGSGMCAEYCTKDSDCPKEEKCCHNGCGHECITPYTVKAGQCPIPKGTPMCAEYCYHDGECPGVQKCCRTTCGHACSEPC